ncbi:MAG: rod shape-determining protein MreC [Sedimentisphaerales bacterium]|nr:rod shape-determining protein MreC [Sedimentisphaerales bacterium]
MAQAKFKPSKLTLFISLLLTGFIFLLIPQNITSKINFAFIDIFGFFLNIGTSAAYYQAPENHSPFFVPRHEHNRLQVAYRNLQAQYLEQKQQIEELGRVRMSEPDPTTGLMLAKIVNRRKNEFIINRGSNDGLRKGQYVLGDNAVIGCIEQVSADISSVKLISSPACRLHVKISAPDVQTYFNGTMQGDDKDGAKIMNVPKKYQIKVGHLVYAAPKAGFLQSPRIIGEISRCVTDRSNPVVWDISVKPYYEFENITNVAVIIMKAEPD